MCIRDSLEGSQIGIVVYAGVGGRRGSNLRGDVHSVEGAAAQAGHLLQGDFSLEGGEQQGKALLPRAPEQKVCLLYTSRCV